MRLKEHSPEKASMPDRKILHVDMDAFFASVEVRARPELAGKPVVVGGAGNPNSRGVVAAASYEARRFGIRSAMPLAEAFRRCPEAVFLPVDFAAYREASKNIHEIFREVTPQVESLGLDEAYLDVSALGRPAEEIAQAVKNRIRDETGLICSIGVANNKLLAKIASDLDKPNGLSVIEDKDLESRIWPLPARRIPGIGPKTAEALSALGIETIADLAKASEQTLATRFGRDRAAHFHRAAHGIDDRSVVTHRVRKSISRETTFAQDAGDEARLIEVMGPLLESIVASLVRANLRARTVNLKIRYSDFETLTRQISLPSPTDDPVRIEQAALACLRRLPLDKGVRLLGVGLSGLVRMTGDSRSTLHTPSESGGDQYTGDLFAGLS